MLANITWTDYFLAVGAALVIYYLYVFVRFRKSRVQVAEKSPAAPAGLSSLEPDEGWNGTGEEEGVGIGVAHFDQAEELIVALRARIASIPDGYSRAALISDLKEVIALYPALNIPAFRPGINEHIVDALNANGSELLTGRDVEGLW